MMAVTKPWIGTIKGLLAINIQQVAAFENALSGVDKSDSALGETFRTYGLQSRRFAQELSALLPEPDTEPAAETESNGFMATIKSVFSQPSLNHLLNEAVKGEQQLLNAYENALKEEKLSGETWNRVDAQLTEIRQAYNRIIELDEQLKSDL
jgi:uncharacterized protein (TIGR02284 family)